MSNHHDSNANGRHILLVDDDHSVIVTLQAVLERNGYTVSPAGSVKEANVLVTREEFHAAVIDLRLSDGEGIETLRALHAAQPHCPGIILTGYGSLDSATAAIREGAYDYLTKPCDPEDLRMTLARAVERSKLARELENKITALQDANEQIRAMSERMQSDLERQVRERTAELETANSALEMEVVERTQAEQTVLQLSAPILPIRDRLLLMPIIGVVNAERAQYIVDHLLQAIPARRARIVVLDFTGLVEIDEPTTLQLIKAIEAVKLLGARTVFTGLSSATTYQLVKMGFELDKVVATNDLQSGIERAEYMLQPD